MKKSLSLMEIMLVATIMLVAILSLWQVYIKSMHAVGQAREKSIAVDDTRDVLEKIRCVNFNNIVTEFPDGGLVSEAVTGEFLLRNEVIVVTYPQGTLADPLEINVTTSWEGRDTRNYTSSFRTLRSRGL